MQKWCGRSVRQLLIEVFRLMGSLFCLLMMLCDCSPVRRSDSDVRKRSVFGSSIPLLPRDTKEFPYFPFRHFQAFYPLFSCLYDSLFPRPLKHLLDAQRISLLFPVTTHRGTSTCEFIPVFSCIAHARRQSQRKPGRFRRSLDPRHRVVPRPKRNIPQS